MSFKSLLLSLVVLVPALSFADENGDLVSCPDLKGKYVCKVGSDMAPLAIDQRVENNVTIFTVNFGGSVEELIADGVAREIDRDGEKMTYVSTCGTGSVKARIKSNGTDYQMTTDIAITQAANKDLALSIDMTTTSGGESSTSHKDTACKKIL